MASTNDLKNGMVLNIDGQLWAVVEFQHVKPGKGPAFVRTKLKNVESNKTVDKTFNAGTKVETATVDRRSMQYLYNDGNSYVFMDVQSYEQLEVARDPRQRRQLPAGEPGGRRRHQRGPRPVRRAARLGRAGRHVHRARPRRDSATGRTKPATLETGHEIQVPLFINQGEKVKVDTRDSSYMGRVKS